MSIAANCREPKEKKLVDVRVTYIVYSCLCTLFPSIQSTCPVEFYNNKLKRFFLFLFFSNTFRWNCIEFYVSGVYEEITRILLIWCVCLVNLKGMRQTMACQFLLVSRTRWSSHSVSIRLTWGSDRIRKECWKKTKEDRDIGSLRPNKRGNNEERHEYQCGVCVMVMNVRGLSAFYGFSHGEVGPIHHRANSHFFFLYFIFSFIIIIIIIIAAFEWCYPWLGSQMFLYSSRQDIYEKGTKENGRKDGTREKHEISDMSCDWVYVRSCQIMSRSHSSSHWKELTSSFQHNFSGLFAWLVGYLRLGHVWRHFFSIRNFASWRASNRQCWWPLPLATGSNTSACRENNFLFESIIS